MSRVCLHLPRLHEVSALFQWNVRLHFQRVVSHVSYDYYAVDGRDFVAEKHVVDDASECSKHDILVWSAFFAIRFQITCKFEIPHHISQDDDFKALSYIQAPMSVLWLLGLLLVNTNEYISLMYAVSRENVCLYNFVKR